MKGKRQAFTCNVILRRLGSNIVAADEQKLLRYRVCVCSLCYPACIALAVYCHLWPAGLYDIFPHYLTNDTFSKKKSLTIKCVCFYFLYNFI